jgi:hypothetical protein
MSQLDEYLEKYIVERSVILEKYVLAAFDNENKRLLCMDSFQGTALSSQDLKNCEFLKDADIFTEEEKHFRNGHNGYRVFILTPKGRQIAQALKQEALTRTEVEATPIFNH